MPFQFGSFQIPHNSATGGAVQSFERAFSARATTSESAGLGGVTFFGSFVEPRQIIIQGVIRCAGTADKDAKWASLCTGLPYGVIRPLYLRETDRYYESTVIRITPTEDAMKPFRLDYQAEFLVPSGLAFANDITFAPLSASGGNVAAPAGSEPAPPVISANVTGLGTNGTLIVTNSTTGKELTLKPSVTGVIAIDCTDFDLRRAGVDVMADMQSGEFWSLTPGITNTVAIATTGGLSVSAASLTYRARWRS